jgi:hypothetical protein
MTAKPSASIAIAFKMVDMPFTAALILPRGKESGKSICENNILFALTVESLTLYPNLSDLAYTLLILEIGHLPSF